MVFRYLAKRDPLAKKWPSLVGLMVSRLLILFCLFLVLSALGPRDAVAFYAFLALAFVINIPYALWLRSEALVKRSAPLQFLADALIITGLVHFTGGIESELALLYPLIIISAGIVVSGTLAFEVTVLCVALYSILVVLEMSGLLPYLGPDPSPYLNHDKVIQSLMLRIFVFTFFAAASNYLADRFSSQARQLGRYRGLWETLFDSIPFALFGVAKGGKLLFANSAAGKMVGHPPKLLKGRHIAEFFEEGIEEPLFPEGEPSRRRLRRTNGTSLPVEVDSSPVDLSNVIPSAPGGGASTTAREEIDLMLARGVRARPSVALEPMPDLAGSAAKWSHALRNSLSPVKGAAGSLAGIFEEKFEEGRELTADEGKLFSSLLETMLAGIDQLEERIAQFSTELKSQASEVTARVQAEEEPLPMFVQAGSRAGSGVEEVFEETDEARDEPEPAPIPDQLPTPDKPPPAAVPAGAPAGGEEQILVVDDESGIRDLLCLLLKHEGYTPVPCATCDEALEKLGEISADLIITDLAMDVGINGMELLQRVRQRWSMPVIVMTAYGTLENALGAMRDGAYDFVTKPLKMDELLATVRGALQHAQASREDAPVLDAHVERHFDVFVGEAPLMQNAYRLVSQTAGIDTPLLIQGEAGTGKSLLAEVVHRQSRRAKDPKQVVDCAVRPVSELSRVLFGAPGFPAKEAAVGVASGGTLLLENVDCLPPDLQDRLLGFLYEQHCQRPSATASKPVDVRVIATARSKLADMVKDGTFQEELLACLSVVVVSLPPLRRRGGDILLLASHFLQDQLQDDVASVRIEPPALEILRRYSWPGNVAELRQSIAAAASACQDGVLTPAAVPPNITAAAGGDADAGSSPAARGQGAQARKLVGETQVFLKFREHLRSMSRGEEGSPEDE